MRIFRYWLSESRERNLDGNRIWSTAHGGSDLSIEAAKVDLESRWLQVLKSRQSKGGPVEELYESDIREELVERVAADMAITRNRYGATILNCQRTVFVDIDWYPSTWKEMFFGKKKVSSDERLQRVVPHLRKLVVQNTKGITGIRIYLTPEGIRAVLECGSSDPRSREVKEAMIAAHVDPLYRILCDKQNCFRVRLTPKPRRIGMRSLNQTWPTDSEGQQARSDWVHAYNQKAIDYAACSYVESIGSVPRSAAIEIHDELSGAHSGKPLA